MVGFQCGAHVEERHCAPSPRYSWVYVDAFGCLYVVFGSWLLSVPVTQFPSFVGWPVQVVDLLTTSSGAATRRRERRLRAWLRHNRLSTYMAVASCSSLPPNAKDEKKKEGLALRLSSLSKVEHVRLPSCCEQCQEEIIEVTQHIP